MAESIYLLEENGTLRRMSEQPYENEPDLQSMIERHPELLAGDQMSPASPRRWLLIRREMAVPDEVNGSDRWSLDHLFVDQDGVPTLVEVKRSSDNRLRREVIGQMLDYAANGVAYWPADEIRSQFKLICESRGEDSDDAIAKFIGHGEKSQDAFWETVDSNLRSGKIRLIFLADTIPSELQVVVKFLNDQMDRVDVFAVELKQFIGQGIKTLVPKLVAHTAITKQKQENQVQRQSYGGSMKDLLDAGLILDGEKLTVTIRNQTVTVYVKPDGNIQVDDRVYSLNQAGLVAVQKVSPTRISCNAWDEFYVIRENHDPKPLHEFRMELNRLKMGAGEPVRAPGSDVAFSP